MITDYTSTYFDFLLVNKPVIFNFYDIEEYRRVRGFSFEPIEFFVQVILFTIIMN
ncbi:CDP-glycerol glycerophosphotransferase family protein [Bacteroides thetaiotaomicron]|nr:CDP-glycerol glycerophosphotransferase family protein [Bacteroides thetaiotaomicron]MCS2279479.1 CDP-glycerol glycerophosphotransferase family protein [Bacteroides thetaiotaomicron]MCS2899515.1 CDP-glycerol glycerophosphotransferase family protein [Bacteroides thetaiotaomicron]MCS3071474.1 CDP-glycerol glycerophosphotransferase family protein [Bacteroides thetaiotaomicron]MDR5580726.1 CDP-glycerol glycerophosphotransferase family protein [Bacteroides thetaiotaomicron]UVQ69421.1 CDP-glycerol